MYKRKRAGNTITRKINSTKDTAAKADKNHYISNSYLEGFIPIDTEYFTASRNMNNHLKAALLVVARITVTNEINTIISRSVRPFFSADTLDTTWHATSLYAALFFSLFYMRPGKSVFKRCANPSCNKYFSVSSTNGRKIYCCKKCRDANNSRKHRIKVKTGT